MHAKRQIDRVSDWKCNTSTMGPNLFVSPCVCSPSFSDSSTSPPRILLLSSCNFISFLFISIFSSKQTGSTARPSVVFCVCLDKLRKQIHWKTIQNSVSKLNNSQLICNKTAVAISDVLVLLAHRTQRQHSRPLKRPASGQQKN